MRLIRNLIATLIFAVLGAAAGRWLSAQRRGETASFDLAALRPTVREVMPGLIAALRADVIAAAEAGADFVGMIFAESSRRVDIDQASAMVRAIGRPLAEHEFVVPPPSQPRVREEAGVWFQHGSEVIGTYLDVKRPLTVGVFADQPFEEINEIVEETGIDLVQLSGHESWDECLLVARQVIQVVHISPLDSPSDPIVLVQPGFALALMLDSAHGPYRGGSGITFDWEVARLISAHVPMMLAGGLNPENIREAINAVHPWAVDVASGTERDGRKDHDRVRAFVRAVREADAR